MYLCIYYVYMYLSVCMPVWTFAVEQRNLRSYIFFKKLAKAFIQGRTQHLKKVSQNC